MTISRIPCVFLSLVVLFSSCAHNIARSGYDYEAPYEDCEVRITNIETPPADNTIPKGTISLGESGFSTKCSEAVAMKILEVEACKAGANLVHIYEEKRPDIWSTCYRCKADFYLTIDSANPGENNYATQTPVPERPSENKGGQVALNILGAAVGFAVGFLLMSLLIGN